MVKRESMACGHRKISTEETTVNILYQYCIIQHISVPSLKLLGSTKTELWAKEFEEFSVMLHGKMGWWTEHGCHNINERRFSKL